MEKQVQTWFNNSVKGLLLRVLRCGVSDAKIKFSTQVPPELINDKDKNTVPGSPWHWVTIKGPGGSKKVLMDDDAHGDIDEAGYTKSTFADKLKEVKARVRSLADKEKDRPERERREAEQRAAQEKAAAEEKEQKERERIQRSIAKIKAEGKRDRQNAKPIAEQRVAEEKAWANEYHAKINKPKVAKEAADRKLKDANRAIEHANKTGQKEDQLKAEKLMDEARKLQEIATRAEKELTDEMQTQAFKELRFLAQFKGKSGLSAFGENDMPERWCSKKNQEQHVDENGKLKHHNDYPGWTEQEMMARAKELAALPVDGQTILGYTSISSDGKNLSICRYNYETNEYVKINKKGLVTLFKPDLTRKYPGGKTYYFHDRDDKKADGEIRPIFKGERKK